MAKEDDDLKLLLDKIKKERAKQFEEERRAFEKEREKYIKELEKEENKPKKKVVLKKIIKELKDEVKDEVIEIPTKLSRAGQKPPPGSKNSDELLNQIEEMKKKVQKEKPIEMEKVKEVKEKKKLNVSKRSFKDVNIRNHLNDLPIKQLKNIARASNLHTRIKLSSPRTILIEAIAQLYEHENGKYKSKPFELKL